MCVCALICYLLMGDEYVYCISWIGIFVTPVSFQVSVEGEEVPLAVCKVRVLSLISILSPLYPVRGHL
jgi:hypothetical protein